MQYKNKYTSCIFLPENFPTALDIAYPYKKINKENKERNINNR
jgi:hypothetical protein